MKILIFDDDISCVDMLIRTVNWGELGIDEFIPVYNVAQAKDAFLKNEAIDIMLCDIEAPGGSGIDLLRWVRQKGYPVENIFLTNYAEFEFAYEAMKLDSVEYILKMSPISVVEDAIRRAKARIEKRLLLDDYEAVKRQQRVAEQQNAWLEYLLSDADQRAVTQLLELSTFKIDFKNRYVLALCSFGSGIDPQNGNIGDFLVNTAKEIAFGEGFDRYAFIGRREENELWMVLPDQTADSCNRMLGKLLKCYRRMLPESMVNAYYALSVPFGKLPFIRCKLEQMNTDNVDHIGAVLCWHENNVSNKKIPVTNFPKEQWMAELKEGRHARLFEEIKQYLVNMQQKQQIDRTVLQEFYSDYMQLLFAALEQENAQGHRLFKDEMARQLHDSAKRSVFDMIKWIGFSVKQVCDAIREVQNKKTSIDRVREYIDEHFCEKILRNDIAAQFYMSEDHISHAFKKKFSITIPEYVNNRRIELATSMLRKGGNISDVSAECGFENISYFSTVFRRIVGCTPSVYKKQHC